MLRDFRRASYLIFRHRRVMHTGLAQVLKAASNLQRGRTPWRHAVEFQVRSPESSSGSAHFIHPSRLSSSGFALQQVFLFLFVCWRIQKKSADEKMERKAALLVGQCSVTTSRMIFQQRISSLCMDLDMAWQNKNLQEKRSTKALRGANSHINPLNRTHE